MMVTAQQLAERMPDARELLSDEPEMESTQHYQQLALLVSHLEWRWQERTDFFIGANLTVYYAHEQLQRRQFRGPDFFLVRETDPRPRTSWVVWEEGGRYPDLIIELLSDSTAEVDRTEKKRLYQTIFHTPEYFWFSPLTGEFAGFRLNSGWYQAIPVDERGWRWSNMLELYLGAVDGRLRYFEADGTLVLGPAEAALQERQHAEQERQHAEQERQHAEQERQHAEQERQRADREQQRADREQQRADRLAQRLRDLGVDSED
ncbi:MAG: Uma2 family endonuclease [Candidatus Contendobacter sp.]|nr:Uma2 family endonuclease [Candidatus Contendobacter sp.]